MYRVLALVVGIGLVVLFTLPYWLFTWEHVVKYVQNPKTVRSYGLPIYPGARPVPYGRGAGHHWDAERRGVFRFATPAEAETVASWYQDNLSQPPWELEPKWKMRRRNPDGLTTTDIRIQRFADRPRITYIFYDIPMASDRYAELLERLRQLFDQ